VKAPTLNWYQPVPVVELAWVEELALFWTLVIDAQPTWLVKQSAAVELHASNCRVLAEALAVTLTIADPL
jgi:hypothetical protein